jgi:hypothetical protein
LRIAFPLVENSRDLSEMMLAWIEVGPVRSMPLLPLKPGAGVVAAMEREL